MGEPGEEPVGRPSRRAAAAAVAAHVAVLEGKPLKQALSEALAERGAKLGGQERRFAAFATRELSRHMRWLDLQARRRGRRRGLVEDEAIVRYALWRFLRTSAPVERVMVEVGLPGPVRPRSVKDAEVEAMLRAAPEKEAEPASAVERAAIRHSFPRWLAERLAREVPEEELEPLMAALNREPAILLRARPPGTREEVRRALEAEGIAVEVVGDAPDALRVSSHAVFESGPMRAGRLQVQDLGSQRIVEWCGDVRGRKVADVCAGAGGKTLALADRAAEVMAGDASARRLQEAKRRARELGVGNVSFSVPARCEEAEVILVDAPCSGTGVLAREPEMKWRLTAERVKELNRKQREILEDAAGRGKAAEVLVYATCSLLREENEEVVEGFLGSHPEWRLDGEALRVLPHRAPGGGYFAARMVRGGGGKVR
ncbi:MAG TPA: RsmB/NOP family class I SAM-dependent RNA methyltransferase [Myxococcaceae bacterium]|nr:RsmB/NOP family class I SAM-dependent RNA methyltransferase [Myxococcaceae bacterium]